MILSLCVLACSLLDDPTAPPRARVPTSDYESLTVEGWLVRVNRRLLGNGDQAESGRRALDRLASQLAEIRQRLPEPAVARLQKVPIWLGVDDGHAPCAEYHPSRDWLARHGYNPDKAKSIEIGNADRFLSWSPTQPAMVLHELAHAYHDQVLGFDDPAIQAAYDAAKASGRYDQVCHADGSSRRAYALTDPQEFFAELSEAFFLRNDFAPFTRAELHAHDPEAYALLERAWGLTVDEQNDGRRLSPAGHPPSTP
ncbi:MAG: metallopeptidase [Isosphaeraceae bacterium]|jgi:hypothetical protein|nr:MAG: metallopeptidase [Isosphaeraceae bacterium]